MKRLLVRSGMTPFDNFTPEEVLYRTKMLGNNSGNLLYAYGVWRSLMTDEVELDSTYYKYNYSDEEIDKINQTYDGFVIPLANAFRQDFMLEMQGLTRLVRKLRIPSYVIGAGINFPYEPDLQKEYPFDSTVKEFIKAVLEKSSIVGVRGEITAKYLENLGFVPEKHMTPIGCPSMYTYGGTLPEPKVNITRDSLVCLNHSTLANENIHEFSQRVAEEFPNLVLIMQTKKEYDFVYAGASYMYDSKKDYVCKTMNDRIYRENRVRFFINVPSWYRFIASSALCVGPRLHGNIAGVLNGVPSIIIPKDARMRELSDYHALPAAKPGEISRDTDVWELIQKVDYSSPLAKHAGNFRHYVDFLDKNGLDHIFRESDSPSDTALDRRVASIDYEDGVETIFSCDQDDMLRRIDRYYEANWKEKKGLINQNTRLKKEAAEAAAEQEANRSIVERGIGKLKSVFG